MRWLPILFLLSAVAACGPAHYEVARLPERSADVYPEAQVRQSVAVAAEAIGGERRSELYFGAALPDRGVLPVQILVTNRSDRSLRLAPQDVLVTRHGKTLDPLPRELVARAIARGRGPVTDRMAQEIRAYLQEVALGTTVVAAGETESGVLFLRLPEEAHSRYRTLSVLDTFGGGLELTLGLTAPHSGDRLRFGPFELEV